MSTAEPTGTWAAAAASTWIFRGRNGYVAREGHCNCKDHPLPPSRLLRLEDH